VIELSVSNKKIISGILLALVVVGSLFALLAIAIPYLTLGALKFVDGAPHQVTFGDILIKFTLELMPFVPFALLLGSVSAFLYPFVSKDAENRLFLRVWGSVMMILFVASIYKMLQQ
jgi:hypothetical protein